MKTLRPLLWAMLMVAAFLYITNGTRFDVTRPVRTVGRYWNEPTSAAGQSYSTDEQNNIDIYKSARDAQQERADALLLERVETGVSRAVPEAMEPLMHPQLGESR